MKMNLSREWLTQRAELDDRAEISAGRLELDRLHHAPSAQVYPSVEAESSHPAFGKLINLWRRKKGLHMDALAEKARIDVSELIEIEKSPCYVPEPRTVYQLAKTLGLPSDRLLELSGNLVMRDSSLGKEAVRFAARSESVEKLSKDEKRALEEFVRFLCQK